MLRADHPSFLPPADSMPANGDVITVPDAHLLFTGQFSRTAHDLILTGEDGASLQITGYFDRPELPALASPDGAMLQPDVVTALAGPLAPGQYAQAGGGAGGTIIGKVASLTGTVSAQHTDGTTVQLQTGDPVFQGDVLQSGPQSSLGIVFADDSVFSLSANARMVLNELVYQPGGSDNAMTFSLVEGTFAFVAGKVAPSGEMKINTPVASMGIRGTSGSITISAVDGKTLFKIIPDPGTNKVGAYQLLSLVDGSVLATVNSVDLAYSLASATDQPAPEATSPDGQVDFETIQNLYRDYEAGVKSGEIQGSNDGNDTRQGSNGGTSSEPTAVATETPGDTQALGAGAGDSLAAPASEPLTEPEIVVEDGEVATTEADAAVTAEPAAGEAAAPEPPAPTGPPPNPTPNPPSLPPVNGAATEGGSSNTLSALANAPGGGTVSGVPATLPAGVTYDAVNQNFTLDPNDPAYDALAAGSTTPVTVSYQVNGVDASVRWVVTGINDAPIASDDGTFTTNEDSALNNINVLINDNDIDGDTLSIVGTPTALHGIVTVNPNGTLNYTPTAGYSGPDTISYTMTDGTVNDTGQVTITVNAVNDAPVAVDDGPLSTNEDTALNNIDVLGNDTDAENDTLTISGTPTALHGTVTVNLDGTLNYTPDANYNGPDTITYQVTDGTSTDTGQVTITVTSVSDTPSIDNLGPVATSVEQVPGVLDADVTISDGDLDVLNGGAGNYAGSTLTVVRTGGANAQDAFSFSTSGASFTVVGSTLRDLSGNIIANFSTAGNSLTIAFTSFATAALVDNVAQHIAYANTSDSPPASISIDYSFNDGTGTVTESITVNITDVSEAPSAQPDNVITNITSGPIVIPELALIGNDTDPEGDALDVAGAGGASGGTVSHSPGSGPGGSVSFTDTGGPGGSFTYTVTDGTTTSPAATVTVTRDTAGPLNGTSGADILIAANGGTTLIGHEGDDRLVGGAGIDTYVWALNDGYDTIVPNGTGADEDIIQISGTFYDFDFDVDGDDLIVGAMVDENRVWADSGGNLRIKNFLAGGDGIDYVTGDFSADNDLFYSPGGDAARIYLSAVNGENQGNYFETIVGTSAGETMTGGGGTIDWLFGYGGDDTMSVATGTQGGFRGGDGNDTMTGANMDDQFIGAAGDDTIIGGLGTDEVRHDRPGGSAAPMLHGAFVNLSGSAITLDFNGGPTTVGAGQVLDNWGDTDTLSGIENVRGSSLDDVIVGNGGDNRIQGLEGDDTLMGRGGEDRYVWQLNDGYDTILANGAGGTNEDIIRINGTFYDYNWEPDGDDLLFGVVVDENYDWADSGGNLRIKDFFVGGDTIDYLTADLGAENNAFYSPGGNENARIYLSAINGTDQGNYFETIIGTDAGETMTGGGGARDWFNGRGGDDTMSVSAGTQGFFRGGDGNDHMTGAEMDDQFVGGEGDDEIFGGLGDDEVRYDRPAGSFSAGAFINLSGIAVTMTFNSVATTVQASEALDNWGDTDSLSGIENVRGSEFADIIIGSGADNFINGLAGADKIFGGLGDDQILGGGGNDELSGEDDDDILQGYAGDDDLDGGDGRDAADYYDDPNGVTVNLATGTASDGYGGTDTLVDIEDIYASFHDDVLTGDGNDNYIDGRGGEDEIRGGGGNDNLQGGDHDDQLYGEAGENDVLQGHAGDDLLDGGSGAEDGVDYYEAPNGVTVNLATGTASDGYGGTDTLVDIEQIYGSFHADLLTGNGANNWLEGRDGNDEISGGSGHDYILGGQGDDLLYGEDDRDTFEGGAGDDLLDGGFGQDDMASYYNAASGVTVDLGAGTASDDGDGGTDTLVDIERVFGSFFADTIIGDNADNYMTGAAGDDFLDGVAGGDTLDYADDPAGVTVNLTTGTATDGYGDTDTLQNFDDIVGSSHNDVLTGNDGVNVLEGRGGDDILDGDDDFDYVDYFNDPNGVTADLSTGTATDGYGGSDTLINIEGILGSFHDDTLTGAGGTHIDARDGADTIYMADVNGANLFGGVGQDRLVITGSGISIDMAGGGVNVNGIETFDLTGTYDNSLTLSGQNVVDIGESNTDFASLYAENLVVIGDAGDQLTLVGGPGSWILADSDVTLDGSGPGDYDVYNYSESGVTASLAVDSDVAVTIA